MTTAAPAPLRTVTFGDLGSPAWGALVQGPGTFLALAAGAAGRVSAECTLQGSGEDEEWVISAAGVSITIRPAGPSAPAATGFAQMYRASGRLELDRLDHELDCFGVRRLRDRTEEAPYDSWREVDAWFGRDEAVALHAVRPARPRGHAADEITAAVIDVPELAPVAEARLSSTYSEGGVPARMGLELWIGEDETEQYPRRVAGEAVAPPLRLAQDGLELSASAMICHSRGRRGTGVYLLARRG